jgi:hypothetical protein
MTAQVWSARMTRVRDLAEARARIDGELIRLTGAKPINVPRPPGGMTLDEARLVARDAVWSGRTHAEVAAALDVPLERIAALITPRLDEHGRRLS